MNHATLIFALCFYAFFASAQDVVEKVSADRGAPAEVVAEPAKPNYLMCKNNNVVRTIRIEKKGRACRTTYTKEGVDSVVGKSGSMALCQDVFDKIKDNLEKASWKCKDITQARVSTSIVDP